MELSKSTLAVQIDFYVDVVEYFDFRPGSPGSIPMQSGKIIFLYQVKKMLITSPQLGIKLRMPGLIPS